MSEEVEYVSKECLDYMNELNDTLEKVTIAMNIYKTWVQKFYRLGEKDKVFPDGRIERMNPLE